MIKDKKRNITDCLVIIAGLVIIGIITKEFVYFYISAGLGVIIAIIPPMAYYISFLWQGIGKVMGFIVSKIILTIIFYIILFPFSLLHKLFAKNKSISQKKLETYWIKKEKTEIDFTKLW
jgi:hypothetical protein